MMRIVKQMAIRYGRPRLCTAGTLLKDNYGVGLALSAKP